MKLKLAFAALLAASAAVSSAAFQPVPCKSAPRIDGKLDDGCWKEAPATDAFLICDGAKKNAARRKTELRAVYTNKAVVFGVKCQLENDRFPAKEGSRVYHTECVEIMLTPSESVDGYFHFLVNTFNRTSERSCEQGGFVGNENWRCDYRTAVFRGQDFWSVEIEIPYSSLEIPDAGAASWRLNVVRESYNLPDSPREVSSLTGDSNIATSFLPIPPPPGIARYCWEIAAPQFTENMSDGRQNLAVSSVIGNRTGSADRKMNLEVLLTAKSGKTLRSRCGASFASAEKKMIGFPALEVPEQGRYRGKLMLRESATNRVVAARLFDYDAAFTPCSITFTDPHYRDAIFATQNLDTVRGTVTVGLDEKRIHSVTVAVRKAGEKEPVAVERYPGKAEVKFEFANSRLPFGKLEVAATVFDAQGKVLTESIKTLRKLERRPWEMYRDKEGNWRRDGKRFFILGVWNVAGNYVWPEYNAAVQSSSNPGTCRIYHLFTGRNAKLLRDEGASERAVKAYLQTAAAKDDPKVLLYYLVDEPTVFGFSAGPLAAMARHLRDFDPYRPILISTTANGNGLFLECGELNGLHTYHISTRGGEMSNFQKMGTHLDRWRKTYDSAPPHLKQDVVWMQQGFNYADSGIRESPIPTYRAYRSQNICALTVGARGIVQYNRNEEQFPELYVGMPHLLRELKVIGNEAVVHPDAKPAPKASHPDLRLLGKRNEDNGCHWLLAANFSDHTREYTMEFAPFGDKAVQVLSAGRKAQFRGGKLTESFTPWEVKVYTDSTKDYQLLTVDEIRDLIEKEYAKRVKPGNLAYQRYENDTVEIFASSNAFKQLYNEVGLWHLADGVTSGTVCNRPHGYGVVVSKDATPGETPDWIEMVFKKPQTIGRVVVYPALDSLKDYQVQLEVDGKWVTVSEVKDAKGLVQEHKFTPVVSSKVRIFVTANRGPNTRIYEIEVYEK